MTRPARLALGTAIVAIVATVACELPASAIDQIPADGYFAGTLYLVDDNGVDIAEGSSLEFDQGVNGVVVQRDLTSKFPVPDGADSAATFIAPRGTESEIGTWNAYEPIGLVDGGLLLPPVGASWNLSPGTGAPSGNGPVAAAGGDYSIGVAFLKSGVVMPGGLYYNHVHISPGSVFDATYTFHLVEATGEAPMVPLADDGSGVALGGLLSFEAPAGPIASKPVTVDDPRTDGPGWTLVASGSGSASVAAIGGPGTSSGVTVTPSAAGGILTLTLVSN